MILWDVYKVILVSLLSLIWLVRINFVLRPRLFTTIMHNLMVNNDKHLKYFSLIHSKDMNISEMFQHNENFNTIQLQCHGKAKCSIYKNNILS